MSETTSALRVEHLPNAVVVHLLVKDLDDKHIVQVRQELEPAAAAVGAKPFVLDLSPVRFVPSLTLGVLCKLLGDFKSRNQRLVLAAMQPTVRQVFTITRLSNIFEIRDSVEAALQSIAGDGNE